MDLAHTSRYWTSYRASKTFRLTIYIYEAHLGFSNYISHNAHNEASGAKVRARVTLPNDPTGETHDTRHSRTPHPVWDQAVVLNDIGYSELVRVQVLGNRKLGDNPVLATLEFEVHDVMGLSIGEDASVFQLECDKSSARSGVILLAFQFDPPVAADVLGGLDKSPDSIRRRLSVNRSHHAEEEGVVTPTWESMDQSQLLQEVEEPVYVNVSGHFACLLLDDDDVSAPNQATPDHNVSTASTVPFVTPPSYGGARDTIDGSWCHTHTGRGRLGGAPPRPNSSQTSSSDHSVSDLSDSLRHARGMANRKPGNSGGGSGMGIGGGGGGGFGSNRGSRDFRARNSSFGGFAQQLTSRGLGGAKGGASANQGRHAASDELPHRWSMPRLRPKQMDPSCDRDPMKRSGGGGWGGSGSGGAKGVRSRGWTEGFLRSPTLGGLRARAWAVASSRKGRPRSVGRERDTGTDSVDSSSGASYARAGTGTEGSSAVRAALQAALALAENEAQAAEAYEARYDCRGGSDGASLWQP